MLSQRFEDALLAALRYHRTQTRKSNGAPYISHPMQVAGIALEYGADEEQAMASLLHDVIEDTPATRAELAERFGDRVADIVEAASDTAEAPKPPWRARKERYIAQLSGVTPDAALVIAADKLHNARCVVAEYHRRGDALWDSFRGSRDGVLWYYNQLVPALRGRAPDDIVEALERAIDDLNRVVESGSRPV